jgi:tRNA threonylcarbamoyl adenosine modification protein YeaZ
MLLAIDTSAGTSVAVVDLEAGVLAERNSTDTRSHAELIGSFIADCLREAGIAPAALSGVVGGMGPGPFTGLRVGIAAARAFAFGAGTPFIPVVSHDAIAFGCDTPALIVTDARRREVYWSAYSGCDGVGLPVRVAGPAIARPDELADAVPNFASFARLDAATVSAASLGLLAESLHANRRAFASQEALYLRSPDVTVSAGPKRVS